MENIIILGMFTILPLLFIYFVISIVKDISDRDFKMSSIDIPDSMKPMNLADSISDIFAEGLKVAKSLIPEKKVPPVKSWDTLTQLRYRVEENRSNERWSTESLSPPESNKVIDGLNKDRSIQLKQHDLTRKFTDNRAFDAHCAMTLKISGYSMDKATAYVKKLRYKLSEEEKSTDRVNRLLDNIVTEMALKMDSMDKATAYVKKLSEDVNDCWNTK